MINGHEKTKEHQAPGVLFLKPVYQQQIIESSTANQTQIEEK